MKFSFSALFSLFKKPELEISFDPKTVEAFPLPKEKRQQVKKATTRATKKPAVKKTVAKKTVAKKKTKKAQ